VKCILSNIVHRIAELWQITGEGIASLRTELTVIHAYYYILLEVLLTRARVACYTLYSAKYWEYFVVTAMIRENL